VPFEVRRIYPHLSYVNRPTVLWTGPVTAADRAAFDAHRLTIEEVTSADHLARTISSSRAIVIDIANGGVPWIDLTQNHVRSLYQHGLLIVIRTRTNAEREHALRLTKGLDTRRLNINRINWLEGREPIEDNPQPDMRPGEIANAIALWRPGPAAEPDGPDWSYYEGTAAEAELTTSEHVVLLKRAFSDCRQLMLEPIGGGFSGAVFRVDALFRDDATQQRPLPFIVKLDSRQKIEREFKNYWAFVDRFVPFHQRALIDGERSCLGFECGILVGTFVTGSESLASSVTRGRAHAAMHSLFEGALNGWCASSSKAHGNPIASITKPFLIRTDFDGTARLAEMHGGGATKSAIQLLEGLRGLPAIDYRVGTVHGDLHARNIHTRAQDAIVLDFCNSSPSQPLALDAAYLEVTSAFHSDTHGDIGASWPSTVRELYRLECLLTPPRADFERRRSQWLRNLVRQVRLYALGNVESEREYAVIVAYILLRHATFAPPNDSEAAVRVQAYLAAERLIAELSE
jgi:hypothetical protein